VRLSLDGLSFSFYSIFVPFYPLDRKNSRLKFLRWVGGPIPQLGAVPFVTIMYTHVYIRYAG